MANDRDIERAKRGKDAWNNWADEELSAGRQTHVDFSLQSMEWVNFSGFRFPGSADFTRAKFGVPASFSGSQFLGEAKFKDAQFRADVVFDDAQFFGSAQFDGATFSRDAWFDRVTFSDKVSFDGAQFDRAVWFDQTQFKGATEFSGMSTKVAEIGFERAFFSRVPDFRFSLFGSPPNLHFLSVAYSRKKIAPWHQRCLEKARDPGDVARYRRLKQLAAEAKDHESELRFFALELKAKRYYETNGFWPIALNVLYGWLSDFGRSIGRPLWLLLIMTFLSAVIIDVGNAETMKTLPKSPKTNVALLTVAATNAFALFDADKIGARKRASEWLFCEASSKAEKGCAEFGLLGHWLAHLQSVFSLLLFFLIGLALRNRFRIGGGG